MLGSNPGPMRAEPRVGQLPHPTSQAGLATDPGYQLLQKIIAADLRCEPREAWFYFLGLPYQAKRIRRATKLAVPTAAARGEARLAGEDEYVEISDSEDDLPNLEPRADDNVPAKYAATASKVTNDQMNIFLRWEFVDARRLEADAGRRPICPYDSSETYENRRNSATHDITIPVQQKYESGTELKLDRKITQFLCEEHKRINDRQIPLHIPTAWQAVVQGSSPPYYYVPEKWSKYVGEKPRDLFLRETVLLPADIQSNSSVTASSDSGESICSEGTATEQAHARTAVLVTNPEAAHSDQPYTEEMEEVLSRYPFNDGDSIQTKMERANGLRNEILMLNLPWERYKAIQNMISAISAVPPPLQSAVHYMTIEEIKEQAESKGHGNVMLNWDTRNALQFEPYIIAKFLSFPGCPVVLPSEGKVEKTVGALLVDIVSGSSFNDRDNSKLKFPTPLKPLGTDPFPDLFARASSSTLNWAADLLPLIFAGECKPIIRYDIWNVRAQLAMTFHATLVILILYYLDTRSSPDSPLPAWMFLYGIEYIEHGVIIHAHHPAYFFDGSYPGGGHWTLKAALLTEKFSHCFVQGGDLGGRVRLLAVLFRIRTHSLYVLERLKGWKRGADVLHVLLAGEQPPKQKAIDKPRVRITG